MWDEKLVEILRIPEGFAVSAPSTSPWYGPMDHSKPTQSSPPPSWFADRTQGALLSILSGVLMWTSKRFEEEADTQVLKDLALALFCWQQDPAYWAPHKVPSHRAVKEMDRAQATIQFMLRQFLERKKGHWLPYPRTHIVMSAIDLARYNMNAEQRSSFDPWLESVVAKMERLTPRLEHEQWSGETADPHAQRLVVMGPALPPEALDCERDLTPSELEQACRTFLSTVDWESNVFLKAPQDVTLLTHETPYQVPRSAPVLHSPQRVEAPSAERDVWLKWEESPLAESQRVGDVPEPIRRKALVAFAKKVLGISAHEVENHPARWGAFHCHEVLDEWILEYVDWETLAIHADYNPEEASQRLFWVRTDIELARSVVRMLRQATTFRRRSSISTRLESL